MRRYNVQHLVYKNDEFKVYFQTRLDIYNARRGHFKSSFEKFVCHFFH